METQTTEALINSIKIEKSTPFRNEYGQNIEYKVIWRNHVYTYCESLNEAEEVREELICYVTDKEYVKKKFIIDCSTKNDNGCTEGSVKVKITKEKKLYPNYTLKPIKLLSGRYNILATLK